MWRLLWARKRALLPGRACQAFIDGVERLRAADGVPRLEEASEKLRAATGWSLRPVPGLIPERDFFKA